MQSVRSPSPSVCFFWLEASPVGFSDAKRLPLPALPKGCNLGGATAGCSAWPWFPQSASRGFLLFIRSLIRFFLLLLQLAPGFIYPLKHPRVAYNVETHKTSAGTCKMHVDWSSCGSLSAVFILSTWTLLKALYSPNTTARNQSVCWDSVPQHQHLKSSCYPSHMGRTPSLVSRSVFPGTDAGQRRLREGKR